MELAFILGDNSLSFRSARVYEHTADTSTLDGGHIMFLIYEIITRRKPSEKFMEYAQIAGMAFLIMLLLYANGNDIYRFIFR